MANSITITDGGAQAILSDEQMLAEVQAAIRAVSTGAQSYQIAGSRTVTRANLPDLWRMHSVYEARVLRARGYDDRVRGNFGHREADSADLGRD